MKSKLFRLPLFAALILIISPRAFASGVASPQLQLSMDTVWLVTAAALVFFMQAGFALLEAGMVRSKNTVNVLMKNYVDVCVGSIVFWLIGYGLMFGTNPTGWLGNDHFLLGNAENMDYSLLLFQTMFAATCVTIVSGAMAERTRYDAYLFGAIGITAIIYPVYGSWAWGSLYGGTGWLARMGFVDFAGSTVVHSIGGWVALAGIIVLGPRLGRFGTDGQSRAIPGHNLTLVALGGFILWLGWFGFNGGSTAAAEPRIGLINLNTHLSAAAGAVSTLLTLWLARRPILMTTTVNGSVGGLVAITAGCATMEPMFAVITGLVAGPIMIASSSLMEKLGLDDVVGAVPVHGFCGAWGTLAAGMFMTGKLFDANQITIQFIGVAMGFLWAFPVALLMYYILHKTIGLRASTTDEQRGLDYSEHHESGYPEFQSTVLHDGK